MQGDFDRLIREEANLLTYKRTSASMYRGHTTSCTLTLV